MGLQLSTQSRHPFVERGPDLYETPAPVTCALLKVEPLLQARRHIWEPAAGRGAIVAVLREAGHGPRVIMLLRLAFLESVSRTDLLEGGSFARIHVFRARLPMMHRHNWAGPRSTSAIAYMWAVWDRGHIGPPTIHRISWDRG